MENLNLSPHAKCFALFTAFTALARTLAESGALDRNIWLVQLTSARSWLAEHGEKDALKAYDQLMEMLTDV